MGNVSGQLMSILDFGYAEPRIQPTDNFGATDLNADLNKGQAHDKRCAFFGIMIRMVVCRIGFG